MIIVADKNIPLLEETFGQHGQLRLREGRSIRQSDLEGANVLLVRSITRVDQQLLANSPVRFVGTASIGFDHLDRAWLDEQGITWTSAPGCNADAAAQYTLGMILLACERMGKKPTGMRAGIFGRGNVGSRIQTLLSRIGIESVACDPPLQASGVTGLVPPQAALDNEIVCLHVPLTEDGPCPTLRMINRNSLQSIPDGALLVNSSRGDVIDGSALKAHLQSGRLGAALDVWPGEPDVDMELMDACAVTTPHIAGYSEDGRYNGALAIYWAFCRWAGLEAVNASPALTSRRLRASGTDALANTVITACGVKTDDRAFRHAMRAEGKARPAAFDRLRKNYTPRSEFRHWTVTDANPEASTTLKALGFHIA